MIRRTAGAIAALLLAFAPILASAQDITYAPVRYPIPASKAQGRFFKAGQLLSANFNSTADQAIALTGTTNFSIMQFVITNCSTSLTTAKGTVYAAASKSNAMTGSTTTAYTAVTVATDTFVLLPAGTSMHFSHYTSASQTIYLSLTTPQGGAATCDVYAFGLDLS